ncbi:MAG: hypothetical protein PUE13_02780 [Clostridiales bacterium]|nr:hypothetical protein [Clostridiales bacterium]
MWPFKKNLIKESSGTAVIGFGAAGIGCIDYMQRLGINDIKYIKVESEKTAFIKDTKAFAQTLTSKIIETEKCFVVLQLGKNLDYSFLKKLRGSVIYAVMPSELECSIHRKTAAKTLIRLRKMGRVKEISLNNVVSDKLKMYPLRSLQEIYISAPICADILEEME